MIETQEINATAQLDPLATTWAELHGDTPGGSFFHTLPWLASYWRFFGEGQRLRVIVVSDQGRPIGIVPFVVRVRRYTMGELRVLTYPIDDWGTFYGPVGRCRATLLRHALQHILESERDWDMIDLGWAGNEEELDPGGRSFTELAMTEVGLNVRSYGHRETAVIDLRRGWDEYLRTRDGKFRSSIRRAGRRIRDLGQVRYERFRPPPARGGACDPRWDLYDRCVDLAASSWQGESTSGTTLSHEEVREFLRTLHEAAARLGMLDVNLLWIDNDVAAFCYNYHHDGNVFGLRVGFDPRFAKAGAGKALWAWSFEDSFRRGDRIYDIGSESMHVKKHWLTRLVPIMAYAHYTTISARSQLVRLSHWWSDRATDNDEEPMRRPSEIPIRVD